MPEMKQDRLALDRASVRTFDETSGHLHVSATPISKANVCPYNGSEIPRAAELGLTPTRVYMLLRDPAELEKAAPTFDGKPLLIVHRPQQADDHSHEIVVGSISNPVWDAPYLKASLSVWTDEAIAAIESGDQRQLSSGYAYDADMTPGEFEGVKYDGVMRNIRANHVALVTEGRAGPDVFVGDSAFTPIYQRSKIIMAKAPLSRKALLASGALRGYLQPKLAADAQIDFGPMLKGVTAKNWKSSKPKIKAAMDAAVKGKLAQDADIGDIVELLDQLDDVVDEVADTPVAAMPPAADDDPDNMSMDDDAAIAKLKAMLKAKGVSDEEIEAACAAAPAKDADPEPPKSKPPENAISKPAMDRVIAAASKLAADQARKEAVAEMQAIQEAMRIVRPHVGEIVTAMDSAAAVYKFALDKAGVVTEGVPEAAFAAMVGMLRELSTQPAPKALRLTMDAAAADAYAKRFPNANRLVR